MRTIAKIAMAGALFCAAVTGARAEETLEIGGVGGANAVVWLHYIAEAKGFYAAQGFKINLTYSQSNAAVLQALTAGSTKMAIAAGFADPMYAVAAGAGVAIVRIDGQAGPYALEANSKFATIKDLKGHVVSIDEAKGTTMVYFVKMLAGNGMTRDDVDFIYAGATAARFAALESGAADAAMITAPQLFRAEAEGYHNLGYATDYAKDVPFTAIIANRAWASANTETAKRFIAAYAKAIPWFNDPNNKAEAVEILSKVTKMDVNDIAKSYDFLRQIDYFDPSDTVSMAKVGNFYDALHQLDPSLNLDLTKLVMTLD